MTTQRVRKAVLPVAGLGTRFLPATKTMPKEMLTVVDKPLIQYAVEEAFEAGIEEVIFVTGRGKVVLEDHFDHAFELEATLESRGKTDELARLRAAMPGAGQISSVRQQAPLGLGHAVWCARELIGNEPFAVMLPDDLVLTPPGQGVMKQLVDAHADVGGNVVAVMDVPHADTNKYGILDVGADDARPGGLAEVKGLVEKPAPEDAPSTLSIIGRYVLEPELFELLETQQKGAGNEIQLTDSMARRIGQSPFHGLRYEGTRYDCGSKLGFLQANVAYALDRGADNDPDLGANLAAWLKQLPL
ncbi:MAG: UTP--glucose-1-phosphate uridylyltransferase GalU [Alphaproteobacteria bacterium]